MIAKNLSTMNGVTCIVEKSCVPFRVEIWCMSCCDFTISISESTS